MSVLNLHRLRTARLNQDPYDYVVVPQFVRADALGPINDDFPVIDRPGSFALADLTYGPAFGALMTELEEPAFRGAVADKFAIDLEGRPMTCTVRGRARKRDGRIHTDTAAKLITVLIYLNRAWHAAGGRLRVLRGPRDLSDWAAEIEPADGNLLVFRRSDASWHGHAPFDGSRRSVQVNWVADSRFARRERLRHRLSARLKRLTV